MQAAGIKRFVGVTSSAVGPHPEPLGGFVFEKILQPYVVNKLGKTVYDDMRRMESIVSASDLAWTIVRPSGLFEAADVSEYSIAIDHIGYRFTARIDLADCLLRQAVGRHVRTLDDRGRDAERQAVDAETDLAGRDPQAVMTSYRDDPAFTAVWDAHHRRMLDLAFRMLFDLRDAGGRGAGGVHPPGPHRTSSDIDDPEGWLVVVTSRLCLDRLRARRRRPTDRAGRRRDPFDPHAVDPSSQVTLVDNVTLAMHALLERLSPAERTSFVLHDVFQYTFDDIAAIVGRSPASCRQLASRARRTLRAESAAGRFPVDSALQREISERFIEACTGGDLDGLLALLDPAVDGAGDVDPVVAGRRRRGRAGNPALPRPAGRRRRCCTCPSAIGSASSRCATTGCWHCPVDDRRRSRRPRRRVGRGRSARRGERSPRLALT